MKKQSLASRVSIAPNGINSNHDVPSTFHMLVFDRHTSNSYRPGSWNEVKEIIDVTKINLIIINDLTEPDIIEQVGEYFSMHPMLLEDALSEDEQPTIEESGDQLLLTLKKVDEGKGGETNVQHIGLLLGSYYVIVFKSAMSDVFDDIFARIENGKSKARQKKADYLFYLLIDCIVDTYYHVIDGIDKKIDMMEVVLFERPNTNYLVNLYRIKQPMINMRNIIYPLRESLLNVIQGDYPLIEDETIPFLQDVRDHINNIIQMYETSRDTLSDLLEINNTNISNRLNHTMKILTVMTTFFVPLTLVTGIYGMNFKFMPELSWKYGYPMVFGMMLVISAVMYWIMKKNKLL